MIPYGKQSIDASDRAAVAEALLSDYLTTGPAIAAFEDAVAARVRAEYAIACSSGTAALHLAMMACRVGPGDRVVTSPNTFLASANCAGYVGATPDFCDIDPVTGNLDPDLLEANWKPDTKAVIAVDFAGHPCDMARIHSIARKHGAFVIEDACHSFGGALVHEGVPHPIGGHDFADLTMFSFHPVKTLTTGEGGMLTTSNSDLAERARRFRSHGMSHAADSFECFGTKGDPLEEAGPWAYEMTEPGFNYRITDLQCALGLSQLDRLDQFLDRRRAIVARYNEAFEELRWLQTPTIDKGHAAADHVAWHLYAVRIDFEALGATRTEVMATLRNQGIGTQVHYVPVPLQPWYRREHGFQPGDFPKAEARYQGSLSLPLYPGMSDGDVTEVIQAVSALG